MYVEATPSPSTTDNVISTCRRFAKPTGCQPSTGSLRWSSLKPLGRRETHVRTESQNENIAALCGRAPPAFNRASPPADALGTRNDQLPKRGSSVPCTLPGMWCMSATTRRNAPKCLLNPRVRRRMHPKSFLLLLSFSPWPRPKMHAVFNRGYVGGCARATTISLGRGRGRGPSRGRGLAPAHGLAGPS